MTRVRLRRGTAAEWTSADPTLLSGEEGYETDTGKRKVGDGSTAWTSLAYNIPDAADVPFAPAGTIAATDVQAAIEEVAAEAGGGSTPTGTGFRHVASGVEDAASKLVEVADVAGSLKPSGSAAGTDESLRRLGTGSTHAAAGDDARFPTTGEKNALAGSSGTPGSGNKYVTDGDARNTDARTPTAHAHSGADITSGTVVDARIDAAIARDSEVSSAISALSSVYQPLDSDLSSISGLDASTAGAIASDGAGWIKKTYAQFKTALSIVKADVGLGNVDNTADTSKPVSTAQQTALDLKVAKSLYDANTVLAADTDDTPAAVTMGASTILARLAAGNIKAASPAELRTLLALVIGTDVQSFDAELAALAGLTSAADKLPYFTGSGSAGVADFTSAGRALVDDADASAQRTTLGLGTLATLSAVASAQITDGTIVVGDLSAALSASLIPWTIVRKASDESVASSTTVQDDDELFFTAASGTAYEVDILLIYVSTAGGGTPDIKVGVGEDSNARGTAIHNGMNSGDTATTLAALTSQAAQGTWGTAATNRTVRILCHHVGAGGTFKVQWAQGTSGVNASTVKAGSVLRYRAIS